MGNRQAALICLRSGPAHGHLATNSIYTPDVHAVLGFWPAIYDTDTDETVHSSYNGSVTIARKVNAASQHFTRQRQLEKKIGLAG